MKQSPKVAKASKLAKKSEKPSLAKTKKTARKLPDPKSSPEEARKSAARQRWKKLRKKSSPALFLAIAIAGAAGTRADAAPGYLDCSYTREDKAVAFSVKTDEDSGKITHTGSDGTAFNVEGFFSATAISYKIAQDVAGTAKVTVQFEIDRTSLSLKATHSMELYSRRPWEQSPPEVYPGACKLVRVKDRKI